MTKSKPELMVVIPEVTVCTPEKMDAIPTPIGMDMDCPFEIEALQRVFGEYYDPHNPREPSVDPSSPRTHSPTPVYRPHYQTTYQTTYPSTYEPIYENAEDMTEQIGSAEVVTEALDREIARLKTQLETLQKYQSNTSTIHFNLIFIQ